MTNETNVIYIGNEPIDFSEKYPQFKSEKNKGKKVVLPSGRIGVIDCQVQMAANSIVMYYGHYMNKTTERWFSDDVRIITENF